MKQKSWDCSQWTEHPDYYEAAYQKIFSRISLKHNGLRLSEIRRMTLAEIRQRLKLHIPLEDIDMYNNREWTAEKRLEWLSDLHNFISNILTKSEIKKLRGY